MRERAQLKEIKRERKKLFHNYVCCKFLKGHVLSLSLQKWKRVRGHFLSCPDYFPLSRLSLSLSLSPRLCHDSMYHSLDYRKPLVSPAQGMCKLIVTSCLAYKVGPHFSPNKYRWQASLWDMDEVCNYMDALLWTNKEFANKLALSIKLPQKLPGGVSDS